MPCPNVRHPASALLPSLMQAVSTETLSASAQSKKLSRRQLLGVLLEPVDLILLCKSCPQSARSAIVSRQTRPRLVQSQQQHLRNLLLQLNPLSPQTILHPGHRLLALSPRARLAPQVRLANPALMPCRDVQHPVLAPLRLPMPAVSMETLNVSAQSRKSSKKLLLDASLEHAASIRLCKSYLQSVLFVTVSRQTRIHLAHRHLDPHRRHQ